MASKYLKRFQVPNEFENILSDFAKEILRNQPKDIIQFGIEYFRGLENNIPLDYKDKGENRPENYKRPENQEPNIINAPNNLEISQEDKSRLQRSMDKIERINKEPEYIPEKEKEEEHTEEKNIVKYEKEENKYEQIEHHEEQEVQVTKQVTVITKTKETVIRNGEVIKNEEKIEQKTYDDNNREEFKSLEQEKEDNIESKPQVFKKTEENQQTEGRYKGVESEVDEEHKEQYGKWFLKHSMNKEGELKITEPKEEPQEEFIRNEMGYKTWFDNNSEGGSIAVNNSNEIKQEQKEAQQNIEQTQVEKKEEQRHGDNAYDEWFIRHSKDNMIINYKPEEVKMDENIPRYEGDYQTWFENHSKLTNNKI